MRKAAENYLHAEFPAKSINEGVARGLVTAFVSRLDPTVEELSEIRTAVSEAVTNAIVHGYREGQGSVALSFSLQLHRVLRITVRDQGCGIDDIEQAKKPLFSSDPSGERGGMGFSIMESFSDRLTVRSKVGKGTTIIMTRKLK